jgi:N-acetylglucosaminyldiphosphoundecaprenol N-acetyl-beta-D-mannosaminyltransferase
MPLPKTSILGVSITTSSRKAILSYVSRFLSSHRPSSPSIIQIVTPNAEQIVLAQKDEKFKTILNNADIALPDGAGVVWGMKHVIPAPHQSAGSTPAGIHDPKGIPDSPSGFRDDKKIERISGVDFMVDLCRAAAEKHGRVLFYGGRGVAKQALLELKKTIPDLDGIAMDGPELPETGAIDPAIVDELRQTIRSRNIRVVFIGLGAPKQEYLMDALRHTFKGQTLQGVYSNFVVMAVGGSFDVLAGKMKRAPKFVQTIRFEWLWRLIQEPWRWRRQWALLEFVWMIMRNKS